MQDLTDRIVALLYDEGSEFNFYLTHVFIYGFAPSAFLMFSYFGVALQKKKHNFNCESTYFVAY